MKKLTYTLLASIGLATPVLADVPVYRDMELNISEAVVISPNGPKYFGDVKLGVNPDGTFSIISAALRNPAAVETAEVLFLQTFPATASVVVSGQLSSACVELEEPAVSFKDNTFTVVLAETPLQPDTVCTMQIEPFEVSVPLDIAGLAAGEYVVDVNGVETSFTLEVDNELEADSIEPRP